MERALWWTSRGLAAVVWASASVFGVYILAFYAGAVFADPTRWNQLLPDLYVPGGVAGNAGMGLHFLGGGLLLVLGSIQFVGPLRGAAPTVHRWLGRVYVTAAGLASVGGLLFIAVRGCVGGWLMDVAFALYGVLMLVAAVQTARHAVARRLSAHRAWAVRLYALAVGSWLYRMDYGFWMLLTDGWGHAGGFVGWFDYVMDFWFYLPNLLVAELYLRADGRQLPSWAQGLGVAVLAAATGFVGLGSYFFVVHYWLPGVFVGLGLA